MTEGSLHPKEVMAQALEVEVKRLEQLAEQVALAAETGEQVEAANLAGTVLQAAADLLSTGATLLRSISVVIHR
jgi:hypothetical protein